MGVPQNHGFQYVSIAIFGLILDDLGYLGTYIPWRHRFRAAVVESKTREAGFRSAGCLKKGSKTEGNSICGDFFGFKHRL
jgi:hypothetical protein